jgi:amino acid adenylation domain-containing protein
MLGILMTGAAYVPFDIRQPPERIARTLADCDARVLISTSRLLDQLYAVDASLLRNHRALISSGPSSLPFAISHEFSDGTDVFRLAQPIPRESPAYILYTSGSTGEPKGVVHSHASACTFVDWAVRTFALGPSQILANFAQFSFDLSIFDIFGALTTGASVHLVQPEMLLRPKELVQKLSEWRTTLLYAVPSAISLLESDGALASHPPQCLTHVLYAGEPFCFPQLRKAMQALPKARFFNLYGPTETNVCTFHELPSVVEETASEVPIGRPCDHLKVELLDESGKHTSVGEEGEVCVAGLSVMSEYFRQPAVTRSAFFEATFFADNQPRYRTGDRAKLDQEGVFWFIGRRDRMVKRRGYRIELGEIESVLNRSPGVREAAVSSSSSVDGVRIHAFVVLGNGEKVTLLTLKAGCGRLLPPYMVPDSISILQELPRTPNGKVDLMRLPKMTTL